MKLYENRNTPSTRRVRLFLAEKGIEIPSQTVDLRADEHHGAAFDRLNPGRAVPVLVLDDGTAIAEAPAICRYIEAAYPDRPPLFGTDARSQALVAMWERRVELNGFQAVLETFRNAAPGLKDRALPGRRPVAQIPALVERGRERFKAFLEDLDEQLARGPWVAGGEFSIADLSALVTVDFGLRVTRSELPESLPHLREWHDRMRARPAIAE